MRDRVICSHEKLCGCNHTPKKRVNGQIILVGDNIINPSMKNCARYIQGASASRYCCLTREIVHIIK